MSWHTVTFHGCADPLRLKTLSPDAQLAALSSCENAPTTPDKALALINRHIAAKTLIPLNGCGNPCSREGCRGFGMLGRGCAGYVRGKE